MILDTSFLLDLKDGDTTAFQKATEVYDTDRVQRVPTAVAMELYYGARYSQSETERCLVENLLLMYPVVDVDTRSAKRAGELLAVADRNASGHSGVDTVDALVAGVADVYEEPVLTANERDFEVLGVPVSTY